ncbi:MAG: hypothetical protein ACREYE_26475 [Gammaproteobacteria bacterium]
MTIFARARALPGLGAARIVREHALLSQGTRLIHYHFVPFGCLTSPPQVDSGGNGGHDGIAEWINVGDRLPVQRRTSREPFVELHGGFSVSYGRKGSFGYRVRGESFELVAGSILVGHPGDEHMCTYDLHERRAVPIGPGTLRRLFYYQRSDRRRC